MSKLDFSGITRIAYKGFEDQPEERDHLLEAGYTLVDGVDLPFDQPQQPEPAPAPQASALCDHSGGRNYKKMYRAAFDYQARHNPPEVNREYWKSHEPGSDPPPPEELAYWERAAQDVGQTSAAGGNDPFLMDLLMAVYNEMEREYKAIREEAHGDGSGEPQKAS